MIATATSAVEAAGPAPWYESTLAGVILGALVTGLVSWFLAASAARASRQQAAEQRKFDRVEARRVSRKEACSEFMTQARRAYLGTKRFEEERGARPGDFFPEDAQPHEGVEQALALVAMEVPEDVYVVAARLRDIVYAYAWGWNPSTQEPLVVKDGDFAAAEAGWLRTVRSMLAND